ncbi:hypothetical protein HK101_002426 [Irineochytrium annulatum]|nr:hypothetical protein HK101_002426 [Irineochytrium annulatum]
MAAIAAILAAAYSTSPNAAAFRADALKGDTMIAELSRNIRSAPSIPRRRRGGTGGWRSTDPRTADPASTVSMVQTFSRFAAAAYCDAGCLKSWSCGGPCSEPATAATGSVTVLEDVITGAQGYVAANSALETVVVGIRGTSDLLNWISDLNVVEADGLFPGANTSVLVHSGFLMVWSNLRTATYAAVTPLLASHPTYTLTFVGHSLGAAVASLGAADFATSGAIPADKISLYTAGEASRAWETRRGGTFSLG